MTWFLNWTTRTKLFFGFGLITALLIISITTAYRIISSIQQSQAALVEKDFSMVVDLLEIRAFENRLRAKFLEMSMKTERSDQEALEHDIRIYSSKVDERVQRLTTLGRDKPKFLAGIDELKSTIAIYRQVREKQFALIYEGKPELARQLSLGIQEQHHEKIREIARVLGDDVRDRAWAAAARSQAQVRKSLHLFVIAGMFAMLLAVTMTLFLNWIIVNPLKEIATAMESLASGELVINLPINDRRDELGILAQNFRKMVKNQRKIIQEIGDAVNILTSVSDEILAMTKQVSSGSAETATALHQTVGTVEEVKQTVQLASEKAMQVSDSAQKTVQISRSGQHAVEEMIAEMEHIGEQTNAAARSITKLSEQSNAIGEIIATVNDLTEQSNLLAVNAAIEAAKAGEHGKGFAVVAQEIKSLAQQSKQATIQVRVILGDIQKAIAAAVKVTEHNDLAVETGAQQSDTAGVSIKMLAESIVEAAHVARQIAATSKQQMVGIAQVALAMENIKEASTLNLTGTRQAEAAAQNLHGLGLKLKQLVEWYKV